MKFAYPQDPTHAVSAIRRYDESSDAATQQSDLERKQDIATVGETVPLLFCHRQDFGNGQDVSGGVWVSPRLIQLGIEETNLSMMYLLSQGEVKGLQKDKVYWGYQKLTAIDSANDFCFAYEQVPSCLDLDYVPGGSLEWTTTLRDPSGPTGEGTYTTQPNCQKISFTWNSTIKIDGFAQYIHGYTGLLALRGHYPANGGKVYNSWDPAGPTYELYEIDSPYGPVTFTDRTQNTTTTTQEWGQKLVDTGTNTGYYFSTLGTSIPQNWIFDFAELHKGASYQQTTEVRFNYTVRKSSDQTIVKSGTVWVKHGATSLTIDGLTPDQYDVVFSDEYEERDRLVETLVYNEPLGPYSDRHPELRQSIEKWYYEWFRPKPSPPESGFFRWTNPGTETKDILGSVVQTIYNKIDFPDVPGGDQQLVGGLSDLTMVGISGDITKLRPVGGPDYFMQLHAFVEQGVEVERLLTNDIGPSGSYPDLVYYLLGLSRLLQADQIDKDSLILAARMNQRYSLFYNGLLQTTNSLAEWMTRTAPYFLLQPRQVDGRYGLTPIAPLDANYEFDRSPITPSLIIDADDIVDGSYVREYISNKDRRPTCLVMVYRDQPVQAVGQTVTVEVRYPGTALSGPFEQHDLTEFCCKPEHCIYAARYILAKRRYTTHTCSLAISRRGRMIKPGDIIRVDLDLETSEGNGVTDQIMYQVESVMEGQQGTVNLELMHFPVDSSGVSIVAKEVHAGSVSVQ